MRELLGGEMMWEFNTLLFLEGKFYGAYVR